jgi:hypothetical protein
MGASEAWLMPDRLQRRIGGLTPSHNQKTKAGAIAAPAFQFSSFQPLSF